MKYKSKVIFVILVIIGSLVALCTYTTTDNVSSAKVLDKERINTKESSYYLIYTDKGEFTITDDLFRGNFKSSTWYGSLRQDSCYSFKTGGIRNGVLSMYPNMISKPKKCNCQ